jgi:hypothetical protein
MPAQHSNRLIIRLFNDSRRDVRNGYGKMKNCKCRKKATWGDMGTDMRILSRI